MELSFKLTINATKERIWPLYCNVEKWLDWDKHLEEITLDGSFSDGTKGTMRMSDMPPLDFTLDNVSEQKEFWNYSQAPMGRINFGHKIGYENDKLFIKHIVSLESEAVNEDSLRILEHIFSDIPSSMLKLKELAEQHD